ncbi:MAG: glycosyltransferase [Desulfovibrio sp.]|nr:glycosyltransferase [Desulfovibrio sp.]
MSRDRDTLLSIIVAVRDGARTIPFLLDSLVSQTNQDFQCVIQDGDSRDGTREILAAYQSRLPRMDVASARDSGIYDAWNRAVARARGQWLLFLGADDLLYGPHVTQLLAERLPELEEKVAYASFRVLLMDRNGEAVEIHRASADPVKDLPVLCPFPMPGLLFRRSLFAGRAFDASFTIAGDYDFLCRTVTRENFALHEDVISCMKAGGVSSRLDNQLMSRLELLRASRVHFPRRSRRRLYPYLLFNWLERFCLRHISASLAESVADTGRLLKGKAKLWSVPQKKERAPAFLPSNPAFSLLVSTIGRPRELERLLTSLAEQKYWNFELILADQNPPGVLDAVLDRFRGRLNIRHYLASGRNLSAIRNEMLGMAQGDLLLFPDDDCQYTPSCLERLRDIYAATPGVHGVLFQFADFSDAPGAPENRFSLAPVRTRYSLFRRTVSFTQCYRREVFANIRFDTALGPASGRQYGGGEDTDMALQVYAAGFNLVRTDEVLALHPTLHAGASDTQKARQYGVWRMRLLAKHGFPVWFKAVNLAYPLMKAVTERGKTWPYRLAMLQGRLQGWRETAFLRKTDKADRRANG